MDNKYDVINEEIINKKTTLYTISGNNDIYLCLIEKNDDKDSRILFDDMANMYDIAEALFQYDLDLFKVLPNYMITPDIERCYNDYYPGTAKCLFKNDEEFAKAYTVESERIDNYNIKPHQRRRI